MPTRRQQLTADLDSLNTRVTNNEAIRMTLTKRYGLDARLTLKEILMWMRDRVAALDLAAKDLADMEKEATP